jgi:Cu+-exporting ATPase
VRGRVEGREVIVGTAAFLESSGVDLRPAAWATGDGTDSSSAVTYLAVDGRVAGALPTVDEIKPEAAGAVLDLRPPVSRSGW